MAVTTGLDRVRLRPPDLWRISSVGLRTRPLRASLSALGIAIGVTAIVAVLGLSASSESGLLAEINALGTNLLTVTNGQTLSGGTAELPIVAPAMIGRIGPVYAVQYTGSISSASVYRSPLIPAIDTNALSVDAASLGLPSAVGTKIAEGSYLNAATATEPVCVLGAAAAQRLGIDGVYQGERIWLDDIWFYVAGILRPALLTPEIDSEVLVGFPAAERYLGFDAHPTEIYLRAHTSQVDAVDSVLAATANPESPSEVDVSQPSLALVAQADAQAALNGLFLALGDVGASGRRGWCDEHHGDLRPRTSQRDRAASSTWRHKRSHPHPVSLRGDPALVVGRCGRHRARCHLDGDLRLDQRLGDRHTAARLGRRDRGVGRHRSGRGAVASFAGSADVADGSTVECVTAEDSGVQYRTG